jgi:hypothetical protein
MQLVVEPLSTFAACWKKSRACGIQIPVHGKMATKLIRPLPGLLATFVFVSATACAPRITNIAPGSVISGRSGTSVNLSMEYLVGWPRVEIAGTMMDWPQLKLIAADPSRKHVPGEELVWIEDKVLQFTIPDLPPADYKVIIHDDKGPPGDPVYSALETTAYVIFPPVWPFVFRSNQTELILRVLPPD